MSHFGRVTGVVLEVVEKFEQGRLSKLPGEIHVWGCERWEADASHFPGDGHVTKAFCG